MVQCLLQPLPHSEKRSTWALIITSQIVSLCCLLGGDVPGLRSQEAWIHLDGSQG